MKSIKFFSCFLLFSSVVFSINAQKYVIAGDDKAITCDGSVQLNAESFEVGVWKELSPTPFTANAICFVNDSIGYFGRSTGVISKTVDACKTWKNQNTGTSGLISDIKFLNENVGFAVGSMGTLLRTINGGDTWIKIDTNFLNALESVYILSADKIFVIGSGGIVLTSTDGGLTWSKQVIDSTTFLNFYNITFSSPNVGYIFGNYGLMFKTTNGGQSWSKQSLPFSNSIHSISFLNDNIGIAVGGPDAVGNPGVIYKTQNGGLNWLKVTGNSVYENYLTENDTLTGVNGISLAYTEILSVRFVSEKIVFASLYASSISEIVILKSIDGGNNWKIDKRFPGKKMYGTYFQNAKTAYTFGGGGFFAKYTATPSSTGTFSWYPTTGLSDPTIANPIASPTETTKYIVSLNDNGILSTDSLTVFQIPLISYPGTDKSIGCEGSVRLDSIKSNYIGTARLKYNWTPSESLNNDTIPNPIATITSNTTYTFTITTPSGCTTSNTLTVHVNDLSVDAGKDKDIICGGFVQLDSIKTNYSGTAALHYKWTPSTGLNNDTIPNPVCSTIETITYTVNVNSGNGSCSTLDAVTVHVNPLAVNAGTDKSTICGVTVLLDSVTTNYTGLGKLRYKWTPSTGLNNDTIARPTVTINSTTTYTVTVTSPTGCTATDNVRVVANPVTINVGTDKSSLCGSPVQLGIMSTNYTGSDLKYKWTPATGLNNDTIANPMASASAIKYTLTVTTPLGCTASDEVAISIIPMSRPSLKYIGVNNQNHNQLFWTNPSITGIELYNIYKETNAYNVYAKIGSVPFGSETTFVDTLSNPDIQSNKYKISIVEQCGTETALSDYHKTLHLSINKGIGSVWNLSWEPYEGFVVSTYNIYRGTTPANMQQIASLSGSNIQFSDYTAPTGDIYYQIEAVSSSSSNSKSNYSQAAKTQTAITSRSNIATNKSDIEGLFDLNDDSHSFVVYPNPATSNTIYVKTEVANFDKFQLNIINGLGQVMKTINLTSNNELIDISDLNNGLYLLIIKAENIKGKQKLLIQR